MSGPELWGHSYTNPHTQVRACRSLCARSHRNKVSVQRLLSIGPLTQISSKRFLHQTWSPCAGPRAHLLLHDYCDTGPQQVLYTSPHTGPCTEVIRHRFLSRPQCTSPCVQLLLHKSPGHKKSPAQVRAHGSHGMGPLTQVLLHRSFCRPEGMDLCAKTGRKGWDLRAELLVRLLWVNLCKETCLCGPC